MSELNEQQFTELHQALLTLRKELQQLLENSSDGAQPVSLDEPIGRLSRMDAMQQQSMARARLGRLRTRIQAVSAAIRRLDAGDYGECLRCGEDIEGRRLQARPESTLCLSCQQGGSIS